MAVICMQLGNTLSKKIWIWLFLPKASFKQLFLILILWYLEMDDFILKPLDIQTLLNYDVV